MFICGLLRESIFFIQWCVHRYHVDLDNIPPPPEQSLFQAMDIPSVHRPPVSVMTPADRVSTDDLPLAESLSAVVSREKYHIIFALLYNWR